MLVKGYAVGKHDLSNEITGQLHVNRVDGSLGKTPEHSPNTRAPKFLIRPGLKTPIEFYCVTHYQDWYLIAISDSRQTRYYRIRQGHRDTVMVDTPSHSFEEVWENLFKGLLIDHRLPSITFYNHTHPIVLEHFKTVNEPRSIGLEGHWYGHEFIASADWTPEAPLSLNISSTLLPLPKGGVAVPFAYHPLEAVHRAVINHET